MMLRKFFGIIFMIYAIGIPIALFKADNYKDDGNLVAVNCPGCGAKAKVYRKQSTDCEYCGTTVEAP
ncbi:hypothetical protein [Paenibacillus taichungensis]|uniref:hypothetical protein n=1 Tax=Paenibacillus taichungensis TaxID=484184 RepID=UPI0035DC5DC6